MADGTDRDRLRALLSDFGIFYLEKDQEEWWPGRRANPPYPRPAEPNILPARIMIPSEGGPKNDGYRGFECTFEFTDDGSFLKVTVEE